MDTYFNKTLYVFERVLTSNYLVNYMNLLIIKGIRLLTNKTKLKSEKQIKLENIYTYHI